MTFYHGTTLDAARQIQREGLKPHRETAYQLLDPRDGSLLRKMPGENEQVIYLQENRATAAQYARFRTLYERAPYGALIDLGDDSDLAAMKKVSHERQASASPAVITFRLPKTIANKLTMDIQNWSGGKVCECVIPPRYIVNIAEVSL